VDACATPGDSIGYGFHVAAVREGLIDRVEFCHEVALLDIESRYVDVESPANAISHLKQVTVAN
jgi:hypothetical protein